MQLLDAIGELTAYRDLLSDLQAAPGRSQPLPGLGLPRAARLPLLARL